MCDTLEQILDVILIRWERLIPRSHGSPGPVLIPIYGDYKPQSLHDIMLEMRNLKHEIEN